MLRSAAAIASVLSAALATAIPAAPRQTPEQQLAELVKGAAPGKPMTCLPNAPLLSSQRIDGIGLVYRQGRTVYVNRFLDGCPQLDFSTYPVISTGFGQFCRGDIARIVDQGGNFPRGSCVLGDFVPYVLPKR